MWIETEAGETQVPSCQSVTQTPEQTLVPFTGKIPGKEFRICLKLTIYQGTLARSGQLSARILHRVPTLKALTKRFCFPGQFVMTMSDDSY